MPRIFLSAFSDDALRDKRRPSADEGLDGAFPESDDRKICAGSGDMLNLSAENIALLQRQSLKIRFPN